MSIKNEKFEYDKSYEKLHGPKKREICHTWQIANNKKKSTQNRNSIPMEKCKVKKIALFIIAKNVVHMWMHLESIILGGSYQAQDPTSWEGKM